MVKGSISGRGEEGRAGRENSMAAVRRHRGGWEIRGRDRAGWWWSAAWGKAGLNPPQGHSVRGVWLSLTGWAGWGEKVEGRSTRELV